MTALSKVDIMYIERVSKPPVSFTYAPNPKGRYARVVRSVVSGTWQKHFHRLALAGYLCEHVSGDIHTVETTVSYTLTALGQEVLGLGPTHARPTRVFIPPTDAQLEAESKVPV